MLQINVRVPEDRKQTAAVKINSGLKKIAEGSGIASASIELAARHGNPACDELRPWGHPPLGGYRFLAQGKAPAGVEREYGGHLLVFQPETGRALEAESFGRLHLLVYSGSPDKGEQYRLTQGGLRLHHRVFAALLAQLSTDTEAWLEIQVLRRSAWWQFWKQPLPTYPILTDTPKFSVPPLDEISLATLIAGGRRLPLQSPLQQDDDQSRFDNETRSSSDSSSSGTGSFTGQGGAYGGGGASGGWDAPGGRGVDSTGRIVTTAGAAAILAGSLAAAEGQEASASNDGQTGGYAGTQTSTNY